MTVEELEGLFGKGSVILSINTTDFDCTDWLEEKRSLYESNKDTRILHEYAVPEEKRGTKATMIYPDDPRYNDIKEDWFVERYRRCLALREELDQLVQEMVQAGY